MNSMKNMHEDKQLGLKGRVLREIGNRLTEMAVTPRGCWGVIIYEPPLPIEIIEEAIER